MLLERWAWGCRAWKSFMGSEEAKCLVDSRLKTLLFMPNFVLSNTPEMSVLLNLVDSVHLKDREIKEVEIHRAFRARKYIAFQWYDGENLSFSPKAKVCVSKSKERNRRGYWLYGYKLEADVGDVGPCPREPEPIPLISWNVIPSRCLAWGRMLLFCWWSCYTSVICRQAASSVQTHPCIYNARLWLPYVHLM